MTFDHPDPSIYCVLASPTSVHGTSNMEFGCFPPRWTVAEHTFRPPPFHRNVASEFLGLIAGKYIGKGDDFGPGSASLHNCMSGHGPDAEAYERGRTAELKPQYLEDTLVFLFETQLPIRPTRFALETDLLERDYYTHWQGLKKNFGLVGSGRLSSRLSALVGLQPQRRVRVRIRGSWVLLSWVLLGGIAAAQGGCCDRDCLTGIAEQYLDALVAKDPSKLPLANATVKFTENGQRLRLGDGFWNSVSGRGTYKIHLPDTTLNQVATIITMREANAPVILVTRLKVDDRRISEIETMVSRSENGAKGFEALGQPRAAFSRLTPQADRASRADLVRVANMYFSGMQLNDGKGQYPFAEDCDRIENGGKVDECAGARWRSQTRSEDGEQLLCDVDVPRAVRVRAVALRQPDSGPALCGSGPGARPRAGVRVLRPRRRRLADVPDTGRPHGDCRPHDALDVADCRALQSREGSPARD